MQFPLPIPDFRREQILAVCLHQSIPLGRRLNWRALIRHLHGFQKAEIHKDYRIPKLTSLQAEANRFDIW